MVRSSKTARILTGVHGITVFPGIENLVAHVSPMGVILDLIDRGKTARDTAWQTTKMDLAQKDTLEKFICQL